MSELLTYIHSDIIKGSALLQCYPYALDYYEEYYDPDLPVETLTNWVIPRIDAAAAAGEIDDLANLQDRSIYIYSGIHDDDHFPVGQQAQQLVYQHYGVTDLHFVEEDIGHGFSDGSMVAAVKQVMVDVGIVSSVDDFNEDESDFKNFGRWESFDQTEFIGIESPQKEKNWDFDDTDWHRNGRVFIPTSCYST